MRTIPDWQVIASAPSERVTVYFDEARGDWVAPPTPRNAHI